MKRKLLLLSTSTVHGSGYLEYCAPHITEFLPDRHQVLFVPYARPSGISVDEYTGRARKRFAQMGFELVGIQETANCHDAVSNAQALFVGGGNTFVLLNELYRLELVAAIRKRVRQGIPYIGASAGSNVAGLSIGTTNDMPIVCPPTFEALGLVPFNINPHYLDPDPASTHKGETRETRIREFHVFNPQPVVGLREGAFLRIEGDQGQVDGSTGARVFQAGAEPRELDPGTPIDDLLTP